MSHCLVNGQALNQIDAQHRGLAFGDGIFETCYSRNGTVRFLEDHLDRLQRGATALRLRWQQSDLENLRAEVESLLEIGSDPALIKIMLIRQATGRGYDYDPDEQRTDRILMRLPYQPPGWVETGACLVVSTHCASSNPDLAGIKHLNRLDSVLARQDARSNQAHEALMCLPDGCLVEGSMSNLYLRLSGLWVTPKLNRAGVDGIIRRRLLQAPSLGLIARQINRTELVQADAALISNSLLGIVPVIELEGRALAKLDPDELTLFRKAAGLNHG